MTKFILAFDLLIQLKEYTRNNFQIWNDFIQNNSRNGTMFHEQRFISYHEVKQFQDASIYFELNNKVVGVFPAAVVNNSEIVSHPGSSYGGLVFAKELGLREIDNMIGQLIAYYKEQKFDSIEMRLSEPLFSWPCSDELIFTLWHSGFQLITKEISSCIPFDNDYKLNEWGRKKNIFDIRKAEKDGYAVSLDNSVETAWNIINNNLDSKYQKKPTHSLSELSKLKDLFPDRIHPWLCNDSDGDSVATVVCFVANRFAIHDFYIAQDYNKIKGNIMPFFFNKILEYYKSENYKWFNFGISSRGQLIKWGILEFKERIGGRAQTRDTWLLNNLNNYNKISDI